MTELKPELKARIEKEAAEYAGQFKHGGDYRRWGYMDGAVLYALKLQQAEVMMDKMAAEIQESLDNSVDGRITAGYAERLKRFMADYNILKRTKDGTANG